MTLPPTPPNPAPFLCQLPPPETTSRQQRPFCSPHTSLLSSFTVWNWTKPKPQTHLPLSLPRQGAPQAPQPPAPCQSLPHHLPRRRAGHLPPQTPPSACPQVALARGHHPLCGPVGVLISWGSLGSLWPSCSPLPTDPATLSPGSPHTEQFSVTPAGCPTI